MVTMELFDRLLAALNEVNAGVRTIESVVDEFGLVPNDYKPGVPDSIGAIWVYNEPTENWPIQYHPEGGYYPVL